MKRTAMVLILASLAATLQGAEYRGGSASTTLSVSATVIARALLTTEYQAPGVTITAADIARGYVDVPQATRLQVRTNSANGYLLNFECTQSLFTAVQVSGAGDRVSLAAGNGWVLEPFAGTAVTMELSYRFVLASNVQPGEYPWPIAVSTRTL
jgi:hypothetical protein